MTPLGNNDFKHINNIDKTIHEPTRLLIMACLSAVTYADFLFLLKQTGLTRGNLSSHMSKLEAVGYVDVTKEFVEKIPRTLYKLTDRGKEAFQNYRQHLQSVLDSLAG